MKSITQFKIKWCKKLRMWIICLLLINLITKIGLKVIFQDEVILNLRIVMVWCNNKIQ